MFILGSKPAKQYGHNGHTKLPFKIAKSTMIHSSKKLPFCKLPHNSIHIHRQLAGSILCRQQVCLIQQHSARMTHAPDSSCTLWPVARIRWHYHTRAASNSLYSAHHYLCVLSQSLLLGLSIIVCFERADGTYKHDMRLSGDGLFSKCAQPQFLPDVRSLCYSNVSSSDFETAAM